MAVEGDLGEIVAIFNGVLTAMCRVVSARNPQFRDEVGRFLRDLPQPFSYVFRQASLREDGSVDGGRILANLAGLEEGDKMRLLTDALSELVYMECIDRPPRTRRRRFRRIDQAGAGSVAAGPDPDRET